MASRTQTLVFAALVLLLLLLRRASAAASPEKCEPDGGSTCRDRAGSLSLKLVAMAAILAASAAGVGAPLVARTGPSVMRPGTGAFATVKAFASGVILATGYMHVLPDAFDCLSSPCLPESSTWRRFPFAALAAMLSALATLGVDSVSMTLYRRRNNNHNNVVVADNNNNHVIEHVGDYDSESNNGNSKGNNGSELVRHRVVAQVLELGIVVHSVVIGLSLGASDDPCTIRPLIAALCFHQLFEGLGLGGCILQAEYGTKVKAITTPFGIALGIGLSNIYSDDSPTALIVVGLLNACSAGLLNYMALVELLGADFLGPQLQANLKLQLRCYASVLLGAGGMSLMAKWA